MKHRTATMIALAALFAIPAAAFAEGPQEPDLPPPPPPPEEGVEALDESVPPPPPPREGRGPRHGRRGGEWTNGLDRPAPPQGGFRRGRRAENPEAKLHRFSTVIEKERPRLDDETRRLVAEFRCDPTDANRAALRAKVAADYDAVLARKRAKLEELRREARDASAVEEMEGIVEEMVRDRDARIDATMARFADDRFGPGAREAKNGYLPVLGAGEGFEIAREPVTNGQYAEFLAATGRKPPRGWKDGVAPEGKERHPVTGVSAFDAEAYCAWLAGKDPAHAYRLPSEAEWEQAAGHMPKDADINCKDAHPEMAGRDLHADPLPKGTSLTTPVDAYAATTAACGAVDMWGNAWEWTSTEITASNGKEKGTKCREIKGGSWYANRKSCRTEERGEGRDPRMGYATVGFRVARVARQ